MGPISMFVSFGFSHLYTIKYLETNGSLPELLINVTQVDLQNSDAQDPSPKILTCNQERAEDPVGNVFKPVCIFLQNKETTVKLEMNY